MNFAFHPESEDEFKDAIAYYENSQLKKLHFSFIPAPRVSMAIHSDDSEKAMKLRADLFKIHV